MRKLLILTVSVFWMSHGYSQDVIEKKNRLTDSVIERVHVLKSDGTTKEGLYQAIFRRRTAVASGNYIKGKKTGVWHFYNRQGVLQENYDYTHNEFLYEGPADTAGTIRFVISVDRTLTDTDRMTRPIKIGGGYYGYIPYINVFKLPFDMYGINNDLFDAQIELLISPLGRLADYNVHITSEYYKYDRRFNLDVKLLDEPDRVFLPATFNREPLMSRVLIQCSVTTTGGLEFD